MLRPPKTWTCAKCRDQVVIVDPFALRPLHLPTPLPDGWQEVDGEVLCEKCLTGTPATWRP